MKLVFLFSVCEGLKFAIYLAVNKALPDFSSEKLPENVVKSWKAQLLDSARQRISRVNEPRGVNMPVLMVMLLCLGLALYVIGILGRKVEKHTEDCSYCKD